VLPLIEKILDPIERAESLAYVARQLGVDEKLVRSELKRKEVRSERVEPQAAAASEPVDELERRLLRALALHPELIVQFLERHDASELRSGLARELLGVLSALHSEVRSASTSELLDRIESQQLRERVAAWVFEAQELHTVDLVADFHGCLADLRQRKLHKEIQDLMRRLREAERAEDVELAAKLGTQLIQLEQERLSSYQQGLPVRRAALSPERSR
jgi:hypothetical protein